MIRLDMRLIPIAVLVVFSTCRLSFADGEIARLTGDTSHPQTSTFIPGEQVLLSFTASGLNITSHMISDVIPRKTPDLRDCQPVGARRSLPLTMRTTIQMTSQSGMNTTSHTISDVIPRKTPDSELTAPLPVFQMSHLTMFVTTV